MDELDFHVDSLERLKYADLQKLAKKFGIKANIKGDKIITSLLELAEHPEACGEKCNQQPDYEPDLQKKQSEPAVRDVQQVVNVNTKVRRKTKKATRGKKNPQSAKQESAEDEVIFKVSLHVPTPRNSLSTKTLASARKSLCTPKDNKTQTKSNIPTPNAVSKSEVQRVESTPKFVGNRSKMPTPIAKTPTSKGTTSGKVQSSHMSSSSGKKAQSSTADAAPSKSSRRSSPMKNTAVEKENSQTPKNEDSPVKRRRSRRDTYTADEPSPGVKDLLMSMKDDMSGQEQKQVLLSKLEQKVQQKKSDLPAVSSHIPRFTGFPKIEESGDVRRKTPGKDWSKIHKQQWDKMDSIDDYLAKKRKRTESVTQSVKKLKLMTEQIRANLKKPKTPLTQKKQLSAIKKPVQTSAKLTKLVNKPKAALFQSPGPISFKPQVTSVSKANFNFSSMYGKDKSITSGRSIPSNGLRKSPRANPANEISGSKTLFTIGSSGPFQKKFSPKACKENIANRTFDVRKSGISVDKKKSMGTPYKQAANTSLPMSNSKKFNMAASLARPITWQTHKGKLKPFSLDTKSIRATDVKQVKVKSREERREDHNKMRKDKRKDTIARRRGIDI